MNVTHKEIEVYAGLKKIKLYPGQIVCGRKQLARELRISEQSVRTCLYSLQTTGNLTIKPTNKYSIITIVNWNTYQSDEEKITSKLTNNQPASNQQVTTKQEHKNVNNKILSSSDDEENEKEEFYLTKKKKKLKGKRLEAFNVFWNVFNYKHGKAEAADAWLDIPPMNNGTFQKIITAAKAEAQRRPELISSGRTPKMAQGWITGRRWEDEIKPVSPQHKYYTGDDV